LQQKTNKPGEAPISSTGMASTGGPTLDDIARATGVHPATVSRALRGDGTRVSAKTREVVRRVARDMGYRPNEAAATLRTRRTNLVGIIVSDLANPLFGPIVQGLEAELRRKGWMCLIVQTAGTPANERRDIVLALANRHVGGLLIAAAEHDDPLLETAAEVGIPVVLVNRGYGDRRFSGIVVDDRESVRLVLEHLHTDLGHRRIVHIAGPQTTSTGRARKEAFIDLCARMGIHEGRTLDAPAFTRAAGFDAMQQLLAGGKENMPTAVFAGNDLMALGGIDALHRAGLHVPGDISVVGNNDMPLVDLVDPPLTTIRIAVDQMSKQAAQMLMEQMEEPGLAPTMRVLMPTLVVRGSTKEVDTRTGKSLG
jgi:LacI family transcriptional regulator